METVKTAEREPYVGPRPFKIEERGIFFGREREAEELVSLITAHPVVLFYAQSGAGKTSLLNAALIPKLRDEEEFDVLLPLRVQGQIQQGFRIGPETNIYMLNALLSSGENQDPEKLAGMTLAEFLKTRPKKENKYGEPTLRVVIFDQFEELFTAYPENWKERQAFFEQVRDAIDGNPKKGIVGDHLLRVIFSMREDYIAEMDPYAGILPENLRTRFRLELMRQRSALEAVQEPLKKMGASFAPGVAEQLVNDLLKIPSRKAGDSPKMGQYIEPVQLQIVCQSLWQALDGETRVITQEHLKDYGDLSQVLSNFYERGIREVDKATDEKEADIRTWFEDTFITAEGTRAPVTRGSEMTAGKPNRVIELFAAQRLLKEEWRGTDTRWYELSHDRFIEPIRRSNERWMAQQSRSEQAHMLLEAKAKLWRQGEGELLTGEELLEAERLINSPVKTSRELKALVHASRATAQQTRLKKLSVGLAVLVALLIFMTGLTYFAYKQKSRADRLLVAAQQAQSDAEARREEALRAEAEAKKQSQYAQENYEKEQALKKELQKKSDYAEEKKKEAEAQRDIADQQRARAVAETRKVEVEKRKTENALGDAKAARDEALRLREAAVEIAQKSQSQVLAMTGASYLDSDPELSVLVADKAIKKFAHTRSAEEVIRAGLYSLAGVGKVLRGPSAPGVETTSHDGGINEVQFSRDGERILTAGEDGTARVWKADTRELIAIIGDKVVSASFSPDGNWIVTGDDYGVVRIWDGRKHTDQPVSELKGHSKAITMAAFSPDGQFIATASQDKTAIIWEAGTGKLVRKLEGHTGEVLDVVWSPDNVHLVTEARDNSARLWNAVTGDSKVLNSLTGEVATNAFSADGQLLVTERGPGKVTLWDANTGDELFTIGGNEVGNQEQQSPRASITSVNFSQDDPQNKIKFLIVADANGDAKVWAIEQREGKWGPRLVSELKGHTGTIYRAIFIPNREPEIIPDTTLLAVTAGSENTVRVWDAAKGRTLFILKGHSGGVNSVAFNPKSPGQIVTGSDDFTARVWSLGGERLQPELRGHVGGASCAVFGPDEKGRKVVTAGFDGQLRLWDARTGISNLLESRTRAALRRHTERVTSVAYSRDGNSLVTASLDDTAIVWRLNEAGYAALLLPHEKAVYKAAFSPNGERVVTASADDIVRIWDLSTGKIAMQLPKQQGIINSAEYSPDGLSIVTAGSDAIVRIWDAKTAALKKELKGHEGLVYTASYSPDSKLIVTAGADNTARVWDADTGDEIATLKGHTDGVNSAVWSADGRFIATSSDDKTARVWEPIMLDKSVWRTISVLRGHKGKVYSANFSPDTKYIVTASEDGSVRIYPPEMFDVPYSGLNKLIEERVTKHLTDDEWNKISSTTWDQ